MATGNTAPIVPARPFGAFAMNNGQQNAAPEARPEAQVWLNIGYESAPFTNPATGETETRFVSIPVGVPLDTQKPIDKRNMTDLNAAQNDLLADLQKAAASLESGEERDVVLTLRMRRVRDSETPVIGDDSPFARKVDLFAVPASNEKGK